MKTQSNTLIAVLCVTAVILAALLVSSWKTNEAQAGFVDRTLTSQYIMASGQISQSMSLIYIIDVPKERMLVFLPDAPQSAIRLVDDKVNLKRIFGN